MSNCRYCRKSGGECLKIFDKFYKVCIEQSIFLSVFELNWLTGVGWITIEGRFGRNPAILSQTVIKCRFSVATLGWDESGEGE